MDEVTRRMRLGLQDLSTNPDWGARMWTVETVIWCKGIQSLNTMQYALNNPNLSVRHSTWSGALSIGMALLDRTLENLAQDGASSFVRWLAVRVNAETPRADWLHEGV